MANNRVIFLNGCLFVCVSSVSFPPFNVRWDWKQVFQTCLIDWNTKKCTESSLISTVPERIGNEIGKDDPAPCSEDRVNVWQFKDRNPYPVLVSSVRMGYMYWLNFVNKTSRQLLCCVCITCNTNNREGLAANNAVSYSSNYTWRLPTTLSIPPLPASANRLVLSSFNSVQLSLFQSNPTIIPSDLSACGQ